MRKILVKKIGEVMKQEKNKIDGDREREVEGERQRERERQREGEREIESCYEPSGKY